jgi:uncharacterized membrane protein YesL
LVLLLPLNVVTLLLLLPVVTAPPALLALWDVANKVARGEPAGWADYYRALRSHFGRAWAIAALHIQVLGGIVVNLWFYAPGNNPFGLSAQVALYIQALWVGVLLVWLLLSQYIPALVMEQDDLRMRTTLRNAVVLLVTRPGFAALLLLTLVVVSLLSAFFVLPWLLFTLSFIAVFSNEAVLLLLKSHRQV